MKMKSVIAGRVDGAARARPHDQPDLRDHARALDVAHEDVAVGAERDDALLDPRAARVVDADHRAADLGGQVHDLAHLLGHDLAQRAAEDGEVLGEDADPAAVDRAVAGDDRVAPRRGSWPCRSRACGGARTCRAPGTSPGPAASRSARARCTCRGRAASPRPRARSGSPPRAAPRAGRASRRRSRGCAGAGSWGRGSLFARLVTVMRFAPSSRPGLRAARRPADRALPLGAHVRHALPARPLLAARRADRADRPRRRRRARVRTCLRARSVLEVPARSCGLTASGVAPSGERQHHARGRARAARRDAQGGCRVLAEPARGRPATSRSAPQAQLEHDSRPWARPARRPRSRSSGARPGRSACAVTVRSRTRSVTGRAVGGAVGRRRRGVTVAAERAVVGDGGGRRRAVVCPSPSPSGQRHGRCSGKAGLRRGVAWRVEHDVVDADLADDPRVQRRSSGRRRPRRSNR